MPSDPPLPAGNLEYQRKQAKRLHRAFHAGDAEAVARAGDALGDRAAGRFVLADAQHVVAVEHGYRTWAAFRGLLTGPATTARPVARIGVDDVPAYEERAHDLATALRTGDADAMRRVRGRLPRASHASEAELRRLPGRDARLVVAREYGYATWRDLVRDVAASREVHFRETGPEVLAAVDAIRTGDARGLRAMLERDSGLATATGRFGETLLGLIAQPDYFVDGERHALGVEPDCVVALAEAGGDVDGPLGLAACFDRVEYVRLLLDLGARVDDVSENGITALQAAIYHGADAAADVLAAVAVVPDAPYVAASLGRVDLLARWFDDENGGALRPEAYGLRPDLSDVGWAPRLPPRDDPAEVLGEAFTLACYNGRLTTMAWLHAHGTPVDARPYRSMTGLHFATIRRRADVVRWLLDHGADPAIEEDEHHGTPLGWARHGREGRPADEVATLLAAASG